MSADTLPTTLLNEAAAPWWRLVEVQMSPVKSRHRVLAVHAFLAFLAFLLVLPDSAAAQTGDLPTVSVSGGSATEGASVTFTVSLSVVAEQTVTVQYATSSGTATSGTDFTAKSGTLAFPPGRHRGR